MILLELDKKLYTVPTSWNELTGPQLVQVMKVFNSPATLVDGKVEFFKILLGLSTWKAWWIGGEEIIDKLHVTDFLLQENTLTKNLLPSYDGFYGPADDFHNLLTCEFIFAEQYYQQYKDVEETEIPQVQFLDKLIATTYRPAKRKYNHTLNPAGDVREEFNDNLTDHYAKKVARWPMGCKLAILHWYEGCRANLINSNQDIFGGGGGEVARYGLWSIMRGVAEKGVHGDINKVEKLFVKVFMMELNEIVEECRRIDNIKPGKNG